MYSSETYRHRLIDEKIESYLSATGAILIDGMRWCGKTTTGQSHCLADGIGGSWISLADSTNNFSNRRLAQASPDYVVKGDLPRLIDEWQEVPQIYDVVRNACDAADRNGLFILTGSSKADVGSDEIFHSGTGRIATITMSSMTLYETGDSSGMISIRDLFDHPLPSTPTGKVEIDNLVRLCVRGGWPKNIDCSIETAQITPAEYIKTIIRDDVNSLKQFKHKRSPEKIEAVLSAIASCESTASGVTDFVKIIKETSNQNMGRPAVSDLIAAFQELYILYNQPAFTLPEGASGSKLLKSPKIRFSDPSLAIAAIKYKPMMLLNNMDMFAQFWDCLCTHDLKIYSESINATLYHLLEEHGNAADSLIQLEDGRIGCFKHVVAEADTDRAAQQLLRVRTILENSKKDCSLLCVICGMADAAYTRKDGVMVVPLTALKP